MAKPTNNKGSLQDVFKGQLDTFAKAKPQLLGFIFLLLFIYITNTNNVLGKMRKLDDLQKELKEIRYEHISTQSQLLNMSRQSEVLRKVKQENIGLEELTEPPRIIQHK